MFAHNMDRENGGITFALKTRAEILSECNHNVFVVTHGYSLNPQIVPKSYTITNIFDSYSNQKGQKIKKEKIHYKGETLYEDKNSKNCYRVFSEGEYKQYRQHTENGNIKFIDVFETPWKRVKKIIFHNKKIVKIFYFDDSNQPKLAKYIKNKNCYLTTTIAPNSWQDKVIYNHTNSMEKSLTDFKSEFTKNFILDKNIDTIFIDKRDDVEMFLKIKTLIPRVRLIFVLHSTHYKDYINSKGLHESLLPVFDNINSFHKIIILTEEQKDIIVSEYGHHHKFSVVSNTIDYKNLANNSTSRKNLISIGRYEDVKNMKEMIEVFDLVAEKVDNLRLDLYGYGSQKNELIELSKGKNIGIHSFVPNPQKIMQNSSAFLYLSKYEGLGLVLLECYDSECPVFSYDIKFGPKDVIVNYENGLIIKDRDKESMANSIISYIKNDYSFKFNDKCSNVFSKKKYINQLTKALS